MSEHPAAYTVHSSPLRCPDEQWLADALLGYILPPAHLDALRADVARLRRTVEQIDAISTRLASQRKSALHDIDQIGDRLAAVGSGASR